MPRPTLPDSSKKPRLTGAERNRKSKSEKLKQAAASSHTLFAAFGKTQSIATPELAEYLEIVDSADEDTVSHPRDMETEPADSHHKDTESEPDDSHHEHTETEPSEGGNTTTDVDDGNLRKESFNLDPAKTNLQQLDDEDRRNFIRRGPCQPSSSELPKGISHLASYYSEKVNIGNVETKRQRHWLSYSKSTNKVFCIVCLAFGGPNSESNVMHDGFSDWHNLSRSVQKHPTTAIHLRACKLMKTVMCNRGIDSMLMKQGGEMLSERMAECARMHQFMERVIDAIRYIASEAGAFRGHREANFYELASENLQFQLGAGKLLNLLNMMARYDPVLENQLKIMRDTRDTTKKGKKGRGKRVTCLSNDSIKKIVHVLAQLVRSVIAGEVEKAEFFALSVDSTLDIRLQEQMAIVLRYCEKKLGKIVVRERMVDLVELESTTGAAMTEVVQKSLKENGFNIERCVGTSFDGASNMQGKEKGMVACLKPLAPMSVKVYCVAHATNLVDKACCRSSIVAVNLYGTDDKPGDVQALKTFLYGNSRKRNAILQSHKDPKIKTKELAATHSIRFTAAQSATDRLLDLYRPVLKTLEEIVASTSEFDAQVRGKASGLLARFQKFESLLTLTLFSEMFATLNPLSKILQQKGMDLSIALALVTIATQKLQTMRDSEGVEIFKIAEKRAEQFQLEERSLPSIRVSRPKRRSDESGDERLINARDRWIAETFYTAIDVALSKLEVKFHDQRQLLQSLCIFLPRSFRAMVLAESDDSLRQKTQAYVALLNMDNNAVVSQLREVSELCCEHEHRISETENNTFLFVYEYMTSHSLDQLYPDLYALYGILTTIPTTSSECERIFSKMKIIKDRLSNSMTSEYLSDRLLLAAEQELMWQIEYGTIIKEFADTDELKGIFYP